MVVVESRHHGGSHHTVDAGTALGIPVGAVPGSIRSAASEGTNALLTDGAFPACSAADILVALSLAGAVSPGPEAFGEASTSAEDASDPGRGSDRYEALTDDPTSLDDLVRVTVLACPPCAGAWSAWRRRGWPMTSVDGGSGPDSR